MEQAIRVCERLIGSVRETTLGARGMSESSPLKAKLIMEFLSRDNHMISRQVLMKKYWMHYQESRELDELMNSLESAGMIIIEMNGPNILYKMKENQVHEYKRFFGGKTK